MNDSKYKEVIKKKFFTNLSSSFDRLELKYVEVDVVTHDTPVQVPHVNFFFPNYPLVRNVSFIR